MESLCFRSPHVLLGVPSPPIAGFGVDVRAHQPPGHVSAVGRSGAAGAAVETSTAPSGSRRSYYMFPGPLLRLWPGRDGGDERGTEAVATPEGEEEDGLEAGEGEEEPQQQGTAPPVAERRENWVMKILRVGSILAEEDRKPGGSGDGDGDGDGVLRQQDEESGDRILDGEDRCLGCCDAEGSEGCCLAGAEDEGEVKMDRDSFSRLLRRVSLEEVRQFAHLSYLGSLAYTVSRIKPASLLKYHRLRFVTSSLVKKSKLANVEKLPSAAQDQELQQEQDQDAEKGENCEKQHKTGPLISASAAYEIAASAASYLQSQTWNLLPFTSAKPDSGAATSAGDGGDQNLASAEVTSFVAATTSSVTAVVAAKEETKQAVAEDLSSARSSPCEWFVCDDDSSGTRFFVIQGSESLASWKANLLFEPIQFEGLDVLVHRGIYEAAKGIYEQMLPEVRGHLRSRGGGSATFRFTGHSLGGSLALLVNLMLLIRGEVPASSLLPVVTFGAPSIMCGGDSLLRKLGLPSSHVQAITMHRDIVPRAFSCNYPDHVAEILKAVNGNFRNHPCLNRQKLLYAPMGEFLILQPEEKISPHHHLLPPGTALYVLGRRSSNSDGDHSARLLRAAQTVFLNSPHPLEMLSDRAAYGSEGTVYRDHDVNAYLRSVRGVIHRELRRARKARREQRRQRQTWWPDLVLSAQGGLVASLIGGGGRAGNRKNSGGGGGGGPRQLSFPAGVIQGGRESLSRVGKLAASRDVHMLVVLLLPAKLLLLGALRFVVNFG